MGKSLTALACGMVYRHYPILVVCPGGMVGEWRKEVGKWMRGVVGEEEVKVVGKGKGKCNLEEVRCGKIVVVSYEVLAKTLPSFIKPLTIICSDSHHLLTPSLSPLLPFLATA